MQCCSAYTPGCHIPGKAFRSAPVSDSQPSGYSSRPPGHMLPGSARRHISRHPCIRVLHLRSTRACFLHPGYNRFPAPLKTAPRRQTPGAGRRPTTAFWTPSSHSNSRFRPASGRPWCCHPHMDCNTYAPYRPIRPTPPGPQACIPGRNAHHPHWALRYPYQMRPPHWGSPYQMQDLYLPRLPQPLCYINPRHMNPLCRRPNCTQYLFQRCQPHIPGYRSVYPDHIFRPFPAAWPHPHVPFLLRSQTSYCSKSCLFPHRASALC